MEGRRERRKVAGEREKARHGGRREGQEQQRDEQEDKNTLPLRRSSL